MTAAVLRGEGRMDDEGDERGKTESDGFDKRSWEGVYLAGRRFGLLNQVRGIGN